MVDRKPSRRCDVQVQVPLKLFHEDQPRPRGTVTSRRAACAAVMSFYSINEGPKSWRSSLISFECTQL
jgi:hypothetical protein